MSIGGFFRSVFLVLICVEALAAAPDAAQIERGRAFYAANCLICHQASGQGTPGSFPPLAKSDFLMSDMDRAIRAIVSGLRGQIVVNGKKFDNAMPPAVLDDQGVADVLTYVRNSFGNSGEGIEAKRVAGVRATTEYPTFEKLKEANEYSSIPSAPKGLAAREFVRLTEHGVRMFADRAKAQLYVLSTSGNVWKIDLATAALQQVQWGKSYIDVKRGDPSALGITLDKERRMYVVVNQRVDSSAIATNEVTIFRSTRLENGEPGDLQPWARATYPWGIGPFNHGVSHIAQGPDGMIYVSSGSRTDGNEPGKGGHFSTMGEHPITSSIWRLDPKSDAPKVEVFARGLRNAFGFCWMADGRMIATDNGPDANVPEELNIVEQGKHYGFPYRFSDSLAKPYPYTPDAAKSGLTFTPPIMNTGPDAALAKRPMGTFDPHSSPAGIIPIGDDFLEPFRGSLFVTRFGNLLKTDEDAGFDLLRVALKGNNTAEVTTILKPLGRPIDIVQGAPGKLYLLEYCRGTKFTASLGFPGRVLEISSAP